MNSRVDLVLAIGQSNMSGRGLPVPPPAAPDDRLLQFPRVGPAAGSLIPAADPLAMPDDPVGIGPALGFARRLRRRDPGATVVVVPAAVGGTALSTDAVNGWRWGIPGNLADLAVQQTRSALAAARAAHPDAVVRVAAILWLQGESDALERTPGETYRADFEALVHGVRGAVDAPDAPFLVGQLAVEGMAIGTHREIDRAHREVVRDLPRMAFARAPRRRHRGDRVHFTAAGQRIIARRLFRAYRSLR